MIRRLIYLYSLIWIFALITGCSGSAGSFPCGTSTCTAEQFCFQAIPTVPNVAPTHQCNNLIPGCNDCLCMGYDPNPAIAPPCTCEKNSNGFITITCAAP